MNAPLASLDVRRAAAAERFRILGVPHRRIEDWKYSDLRAVLGADVPPSPDVRWRIASVPEGIELVDLATQNFPPWVSANLGTNQAGGAMSAASLGSAKGGFALRVAHDAGAVDVEFSGAGPLRALILVEKGASLTLLERHHGDQPALRNIGIEIVLAECAAFTHVRLAPRLPAAIVVEEIAIKVARAAQYIAHFANFGARLSRTELDIALEGEGAEAHLSGVSVLGGETHADVTTHVAHAVPRTQSTQLFKYVAGGRSRAIYQGKVTVAPGAILSDSRQTAKGLLIGPRAEIDLKPELEILADDVKCAHGAAVGDLDAESIFYLRSRGIGETEARNLLIRAFLNDAISGIADEDIRLILWKSVEAALSELLP